MLLDSGASCNVIDQQLWEQLRQKEVVCKSQAVNKTLKSCGTVKKVEVIAKFWCKVELGVKSLTDVEFLVIKGKGRPILGRKTAMNLGVLKITIPEVNLVEDEFQDLFREKIGKLRNCEVELHLKPNAKFVAQPCRRIPYSQRAKFEKNLLEQEELDIIERVEGPTPCVSPIVVVPKESGDIRICVDKNIHVQYCQLDSIGKNRSSI